MKEIIAMMAGFRIKFFKHKVNRDYKELHTLENLDFSGLKKIKDLVEPCVIGVYVANE